MDYGAIIRETERGRGRKVVVLCLALLMVALVIGAVVRGFRGHSSYDTANALTGSVVCLLAGPTLRRRIQSPRRS
jgi:hypothetical protein